MSDDKVVGDLAMIVRRLVHALKKSGGNAELCESAMGYLRRNNLSGDSMRELQVCFSCRHHQREQTGPHEWAHHCSLQQQHFPNGDHCGKYHPDPKEQDKELDRWPVGAVSNG